MKKINPLRESSPRPGIQVLARAASILRALEGEADGLSLGQLAIRLSLPRSTVQRIVSALQDEQFLVAAGPRSRVKLGPAILRLANSNSNDTLALVRPFLEDLSRTLNETVDLSVVEGDCAVFVHQTPGKHRLRTVSAIGEEFPLHCTACGKALLAALPSDRQEAILNAPLDAYTDQTTTNAATLKTELARIRKTAIAYDIEEHTDGICAAGTAFIDANGRAFAISIPTPVKRFQRDKSLHQRELLKCRTRIISALDPTTNSAPEF